MKLYVNFSCTQRNQLDREQHATYYLILTCSDLGDKPNSVTKNIQVSIHY